ncbi:MAG: aspartate kinase [Polyangiaceae bacterium]
MPIVVQKYGGSSVADVAKIGAVADRVVAAKRAGADVVVVVSAMGKTTDQLLALAKSVAGEGAASENDTKNPARRELDMLVSTGERVTMALLSIAIHARGEDAISFTGSQSGIITNDRHFDARILEVRPHRIEDELARGRIVIVAGYQGMSYKREITTLGRGGSDTTAVALAAALGAEHCEIYSDVDGVYSADPRVVPEARHLPEISTDTLQEMAEAGAKVLNAQAVEWARRAKITLHARKTNDPLPTKGKWPRETLTRDTTSAEGTADRPSVRAIVGFDRVVLGTVPWSSLSALTKLLSELGIPTMDLAAGGADARFVVPLLNVPDWSAGRARLEAAFGASLRLVDDAAVVSVVGDDLTRGDALGRFTATLAAAHVEIASLVAGPLRIGAVVSRAHLDAAQKALHAAFVVGRDL